VFWCELNAASAPGLRMNETDDGVGTLVRPAPQPRGPQRTLLYVEDNPANLELVSQLMERRPDIRLLTAVTGALGVAVAREALPLVILMDINLPGMSGVGALKILGGDPATAHIPVIALSANAMPRDVATGLELGFFRYLTKPIKVPELMDTLDVAFEAAEKRPAPAPGEGRPA